MKKTAQSTSSETMELQLLSRGAITLCIRGTSPFIYNAMSAKAQQELLMPRGRLSASDKAVNLKHDPISEYRSSVYAHRDDDHATRLMFPATAFKKAAMTAALRTPGVKKTEIGQLLWIEGQMINMYGIPQIYMCVTRQADMNRTPDVRTRALLPEWACELTVNYVTPNITANQVGNLLANAGLVCGVGDFRPEKGTGNYGQFEIVGPDDLDYVRIKDNCGREAQDKALLTPASYDRETDELLGWFFQQAKNKERKVAVVGVA